MTMNRALHCSMRLSEWPNLILKTVSHTGQPTGLEKWSHMLATQLTAEAESRSEPTRVSSIHILWCWASSLLLVMLTWFWVFEVHDQTTCTDGCWYFSLSQLMTSIFLFLTLPGSGCSTGLNRDLPLAPLLTLLVLFPLYAHLPELGCGPCLSYPAIREDPNITSAVKVFSELPS